MCGSSISMPAAPDPAATAQAQYGYSKKAAEDALKMGSINQYGPYGSTTYQKDPKTGLPISQTVDLSPGVQEWLDKQFAVSGGLDQAAINQLGNMPTDKFSLSSIPSTDAIAQTAYQRQVDLMKPQFNEATNAMEVNLANRGIPVGSEIWNNESNRLERSQDAALKGAAQDATLLAAQEQQRLLGNAVTEREMPFKELASYLGTSPNFQTPDFMKTPTVNMQSPDYTGLVNNNYNQAMNQYNIAQQGLWSGIAGLGRAAMPLIFTSDKNLKEDRKPADGESILMILRDMPVDDYRYKDEAQKEMGLPEHRTGPMAQDYEEAFPEGSDGHMIDIADVVGKLLGAVKALDRRTMDEAPKAKKA